MWVSQTYLRTCGCSLPKPEADRGAGGIHEGESDLPRDLAAHFQSPKQTEELEEYTRVSQTYLGT